MSMSIILRSVLLIDFQSTKKFCQGEGCYLQAGKVKVLLKLLNGYQNDGRRVLIFSQVRYHYSFVTSTSHQ